MTHIVTSTVPTIFLHGFSGDEHGLRPFADKYVGPEAICINLPGFGGSADPSTQAQKNFMEYAEETWRRIRDIVPAGSVQLVGHSHGTMVGFAIACAHPDEVTRLDLLCPVAKPRFLPRLLGSILSGLAYLGVVKPLIRIMAWRPMVDMVTRYSYQPSWDSDTKRAITQMRRGEAAYYSPSMFKIMHKAVNFAKIMKTATCTVPTAICYVSDDNVSGGRDHEWYQKHSRESVAYRTIGGHLCVVAEPGRIASEFLAYQRQAA